MRQRRALRRAGRARRVLDVDRDRRTAGATSRSPSCDAGTPSPRARERSSTTCRRDWRPGRDRRPCAAPGDACSERRRRGRVAERRRQLGQHLDVVGVAEAAGRDEDRDARLPQGVLELAQAIRRIDVDENRAGLRRRVLRDHPLRAVRAPDPDAIARLDAECQQSAGNPLDLGSKPGVGVAERLVARHQGVGVRMGRGNPIETRADASRRAAAGSTVH